MAFFMLFAAVVGVVQLAVIAGWVRSVRITTLIQAVVIGAVVCGPVTVGVQWVVSRVIQARTSRFLGTIVEEAGRTYDPVVEEILKLLPLLLLAIFLRRVHRQLGWTDHFMIGTALGSGFALAEALMRFSITPRGLLPAGGGYVVGGVGMIMHTPASALMTWQPQPVELGSGVYSLGHALWTGVAALGVAWLFRSRVWLKPLGVVPLALSSFSHMYYNAQGFTPLTRTWMAQWSTQVFMTLHDHLIWLVLALIAADRFVIARASARSPGLLLPGESKYALNPWPVLKAGVIGAPWSVLPAWNVALQRRAAWYGLGARLPEASASAAVTAVGQLGRVRRSDWRAGRERGLLAALRRGNWQVRVNWRTVVVLVLWVVSVIPGLVFLVVGGWPTTRWVQQAMLGPVGAVFLVLGVLAGVAFMVSRVPALIKGLRRLPRPAWHEMRLRPLGRLAIAATSVFTSGMLIARLFTTGDATAYVVQNFHILEALANLLLAAGLALMIVGLIWFPPSLLMLGGLGTLELVISQALLVTETVGLATALTGAALSQAAGQPPGGGDDGREEPAEEAPNEDTGKRFSGDPEPHPTEEYDAAAHKLADRIGGEPQQRFPSDPNKEFDAISKDYVAESKGANFTGGKQWRNQAKLAFQAAQETGRTPYFHFNGPPGPKVYEALARYAERYMIEPIIDITPLP